MNVNKALQSYQNDGVTSQNSPILAFSHKNRLNKLKLPLEFSLLTRPHQILFSQSKQLIFVKQKKCLKEEMASTETPPPVGAAPPPAPGPQGPPPGGPAPPGPARTPPAGGVPSPGPQPSPQGMMRPPAGIGPPPSRSPIPPHMPPQV